MFSPSGDSGSAAEETNGLPLSLGAENTTVSPFPPALLLMDYDTPPTERWGSLTAPLASGQAGDTLGLRRLGHQRGCSLHLELSGTPATGTRPPSCEEAEAATLKRPWAGVMADNWCHSPDK